MMDASVNMLYNSAQETKIIAFFFVYSKNVYLCISKHATGCENAMFF